MGRTDLQTWINDLPAWLAAYNKRNGTALTQTTVLSDAGGQRGLIQHFYGGLLDDELRALADVVGNAAAFAQLNPAPAAPSPSPLTDTVNGNGFGRNLYGLRSVNAAGARSSRTPSVGPIYTRTVLPVAGTGSLQGDRAANDGGFHPGVGPRRQPGCRRLPRLLVARGSSDLADLRWFGPDPVHPADPATLAQPQLTPGAWRPLSLTAVSAIPD